MLHNHVILNKLVRDCINFSIKDYWRCLSTLVDLNLTKGETRITDNNPDLSFSCFKAAFKWRAHESVRTTYVILQAGIPFLGFLCFVNHLLNGLDHRIDYSYWIFDLWIEFPIKNFHKMNNVVAVDFRIIIIKFE